MKTGKILLITGVIAMNTFAQPPYQYTDQQLKARLPAPILDDHPDWITLYWKAWNDCVAMVQRGTAQNGFVPYYIQEVFNYPAIFQWDAIFSIAWQRYGFHLFPTLPNFDNFYNKQHADGFIARSFNTWTGADDDGGSSNGASMINPPLFSWGEWLHYMITADTARLAAIFPKLEKYYEWVKANRRWPNGTYWNTGYGSGLDNSPRGLAGVHDNASHGWIDMTSQVAQNARYMQMIAGVINKPDRAAYYAAEFTTIKNLINQNMWDANRKFYFDTDQPQGTGTFTGVYTIINFWPMLAGVADQTQCASLIPVLTDARKFWRTHVFPTLAADNPSYAPRGNYWCGSVWAPTTYMVIKGLEENGYDSLARIAAENDIEGMSRVYKSTNSIWENYAPDYYERGSQSMSPYNWSCVGPIAELIENVIGIRVNAPASAINWHIDRTERHGIQRLRMADDSLSLVCARRTSLSDAPVITVSTSRTLTLRIHAGKAVCEKTIPPSTNYTFTCAATGIQTGSSRHAAAGGTGLVTGSGRTPQLQTPGASAEILNAKGSVVRGADRRDPVPTAALPNGVYLVRGRTPAGEVVGRTVVVR
jgi:hypothetical protein